MHINSGWDNISELFSGQKTVDMVCIVNYVEWITNKDHVNHGLVALPPIQRNSIWKPGQIVDLWDSLLRGMPFGSFLVARMKAGDTYRKFEGTSSVQEDINSSQQNNQQNKGKFFLLDGQQRTLTVCLGYYTITRARLWLDLGQPGTQGRAFSLRLTTVSQPFGFDPNNPSRKLSAAQKRDARETFVKEYPQCEGKYDHDLSLQDTRPWKVTLPVPIIELWQAWRKCGKGSSGNDWWEQVVMRDEKVSVKLKDARPKIVEQLPHAFERLDTCMIPLILVPDDVLGATPEGRNGTPEDAIETLYTRIGTGGTVLSGEEHIFSLIKHRWPQAHDIVHGLYNDTKIGQILKPTEIVMTAVRLVRANEGEDDVPKPRVSEFRRWLTEPVRTTRQATALEQGKEETSKPLLKTLQEFVEPSRLQAAFTQFRDLIDYRREDPLDPGLPKAYVPYLNLPAIQVVLRWIDLHRGRDRAFFQGYRKDILRFLLFWHIAVDNEDEASKCVFGMVQSDHNFPGRLIYNTLTTRNEKGQTFARCLPSPKTLHTVLGTKTGQLRTWIERFDPAQRQDDEEKSAITFLQRWWSAKELLLWLQRQWVDTWFERYDPLAGRDEDTPYDYDHILPRDYWLRYSFDGEDAEARRRFDQWRDLIGNAIGNYRVWPSGPNRGDGAEPPSSKLKLAYKPSDPLCGDWADLKIKTAGDLLAASAIGMADAALWTKASGDNPKLWSYDRVAAFQAAVENRVASLYERFYHELHFTSWT